MSTLRNAILKAFRPPPLCRAVTSVPPGKPPHPNQKPYYVTTPIFYPNSVPHIGHLHSLVIGDIFARFAKLTHPERPVRFVNGTDEHGLKIQKAARAKGMEPLAFCNELSQHFRNLTVKANAGVTKFARTTEKEHYEAVQYLWRQLDAKGLIYKGKHEGWYSVSDECFYTEAQVTKVHSSEANGEACYISTETGSRVEWTSETNYKFRLSAFREFLLSRYETDTSAIFPIERHDDVLRMLDKPLEDLSISRPQSRLDWGIPVPNDPEHTIYVWIDALTTYLSAVGYPWSGSGDKGKQRDWPPNVQIIGKDILRFHAIYFPAMLRALDLPLSTTIIAHSHWTVDQRKMSKSIGNVADPIEAIDEFGVDVVRYYLARVGGRFKDDVDWSHDQLEKHAREITSLLGNLYLRITSKKIQDRLQDVPLPRDPNIVREDAKTGQSDVNDACNSLLEELFDLPASVTKQMNLFKVADTLESITNVLQGANQYMTLTKPWAASTPAITVACVQMTVLECLRVCGILLQPFMPTKSSQLLDALDIPTEERSFSFAEEQWRGVGKYRPGVRLFENTSEKKRGN